MTSFLNINRCFLRFEDRAERITTKQVVDTFVSIGPLMDLLDSRNNQIIYGRRGTGKTHALRYFQDSKNKNNDLAIFIDAQNIGSNGSIYNDHSLEISERATRLLVDVCFAIHHELLEIFTDPERGWDISEALPILDKFSTGFTEKRIAGTVQEESISQDKRKTNSNFSAGLKSSPDGMISPSLGGQFSDSQENSASSRYSSAGTEESWVNFNYFSQTIRELAGFVKEKRIWILIDEWTTIPPDIQPYLADLIRRSLFSVPNITTKIAAIEHRARFKIERDSGGYIGFELGADVNAAVNLDDSLVIDNNESRAKEFFRHFITNHATTVAQEINVDIGDIKKLVSTAFTQENVFTEFVRSTEGVPRDAMHILSLAAQQARENQISMPAIRDAAHSFFFNEKYSTIQANPVNRILLDWIRDEVISNRRTRAFLLPVGTEDTIIDRLFDQRALHILNRSRSAAHRPGERFVVYKIDYGLYVDLANTDKFPAGLLLEENVGSDVDFEVPLDDARSYRRAILNLEKFYETYPEARA